MLDIVVDSREGRSPVWAALHSNPDVRCEVRELSCGDYLPHPSFGIERKTANDFVVSIMDRRLFAQVLRLTDEFERFAFVIEGDIYSTRSGINPDAVRGALSYLMTLGKASVIQVKDAKETAALLVTMARHLQQGLGYEVSLRSNKPKDLRDLVFYLLEGLPGVGPSSARALALHFKSVHAVLSASVEDLCQAPGIGKKTALRIREAIEHSLL